MPSLGQLSINLIENGFGFKKQDSLEVSDNKALMRHQVVVIISNQDNRLVGDRIGQSAAASSRRIGDETPGG